MLPSSALLSMAMFPEKSSAIILQIVNSFPFFIVFGKTPEKYNHKDFSRPYDCIPNSIRSIYPDLNGGKKYLLQKNDVFG